MKRKSIRVLLCCSFFAFFATPSLSQEAYEPPPMFGNTEASIPLEKTAPIASGKPAPVIPNSESLLGFEGGAGTDITPKKDSRVPIMLPQEERSKPILENKPENKAVPKTAPNPPSKKPIVKKTNTAKAAIQNNKKNTPASIKEKEKPQQARKLGPKMPAVPARPVEQEILPDIITLPPPEKIEAKTDAQATAKIQDKALEQKMVTPSAEALLEQIENKPAIEKAGSGIFINERALGGPVSPESPAGSVRDDVLSALPPSPSQVKTTKEKATHTQSESELKTHLEKVTIPYKPNLSDILNDQIGILMSDVLPKLEQDKSVRLQIQAYASPSEDGGQSSARRISLSRALSIRSWLIEHNIDASRMDVRALGLNTDQQPLDRVDIVFVGAP